MCFESDPKETHDPQDLKPIRVVADDVQSSRSSEPRSTTNSTPTMPATEPQQLPRRSLSQHTSGTRDTRPVTKFEMDPPARTTAQVSLERHLSELEDLEQTLKDLMV